MNRVFLRADLNVPLHEKKIIQDHRLRAILPTIDEIKKRGDKIILATHIGRPPAASQKNFFDENLSTKLLIPWFEERGYEIEYEIDLLQAIEKSKADPEKILLLENLRFFNGEKETNIEFAKLLAQLADEYVNDAFGLLHRNDTSVTLLPQEFPPEKRSFGPIVKRELETLSSLKQNPARPLIFVIGGNKGKTKLKLLETLLDAPAESRPDKILVGGALALDLEVSDPIIMLPIDSVTDSSGKVVDIGPETIELFRNEISQAKTIFANGTMGIYENPESEAGTREILHAIANSSAYKIIGGGDCVAATFKFGFDGEMDFLSTGGGATMAMLAGSELPALHPPS